MSSATVYISMEAMTRRVDQCPHYCEERQDLYAPDVTQGPDGRYYLYYDLSGMPKDEEKDQGRSRI